MAEQVKKPLKITETVLHDEVFELGTRKNMRMQRFSKKISESECF